MPFSAPSFASVFIDFEASSLDGYPIEVGWAVADPETGVITAEGHLVRPTEEWLAASDRWDPSAERVHGLTRNELVERGKSVEDVARLLRKVLYGHKAAYSDNVVYDDFWLKQLASAAGHKAGLGFYLLPVEASLLPPDQKHMPSCQAKQKIRLDAAASEAGRLSPPTHCAPADAAFWAACHLIAQGLGPVLKKGPGWR